MKKFRLLLFAACVTVGANAQYFQDLYGGPARDFLESGVNANAGYPQGHLMTGYTNEPGYNCFMVTYTDLDGRFVVPPFFNNNYPLVNSAGQKLDAKGRRLIQPAAAGGLILVWGDYTDGSTALSDKFFYAAINPIGIAAFAVSYQLPFPVVEAEATSMTYSTTQPNTVYVCGFVRRQPGGLRYPIIMSINDVTGAINWSGIYQVVNTDWTAMDLVESPYLTSSGIPDIALTGHFIKQGLPSTGCFWLVSTTTGAVTSPVVQYGTPFSGNNSGAFNAIDIANNPFGSGPGFVMAGYYHNPANGNNDMWAMKVSPNGMIVNFTTLIDYSNPGNDEYGNDIIERFNTSNNYEYYVGGYVKKGVFGGDDALVQKLDFAGIPAYPKPQFTYGGPGDERALQLDQYNFIGPNNDGLSTFGSTDGGSFPWLGGNDFYFTKSYFNGVTGCNYDLSDPFWTGGPRIAEVWSATIPDKLKQSNLQISSQPMQDKELCWTPFDASGSNARLAAAATSIEQPGYFPNPVSRENGLVTVTFGKETIAGVAQVELRNALGQIVWSKQLSIADGQTNMQIELGNELNAGMYHLIINQNGTLNNYRILVQ